MSGSKRGFQVLETQELPATGPVYDLQADLDTIERATQSAEQRIAAQQAQATKLTLLALQTLSQKALVAWSTLFTAGALASAWVLWRSILPEPTPLQLIGLGGYAFFILAIEFIRRR